MAVMPSLQETIRTENRVLSSPPAFEAEDRIADPALDELVRLAIGISGADGGYFAWLNGSGLCLKSTFGFNALEQPGLIEACNRETLSGAALLVKDTVTDSRLNDGRSELAFEDWPRWRSYLGIPMIGSGDRVVGVLAVLAVQAGRFSPEHRQKICVLGRQVVTRMELYARAAAHEHGLRSRHRLERALAVKCNFAAVTLDSIPALVAVLGTAGPLMRINRSCEELTGLRMGEVVGRGFVDELLVESEARGWAQEKLRQAAAGEGAGPFENLWRNKLGKPRRVSWTLRPMMGPSDDIDSGAEPDLFPDLAAGSICGVRYLIVSGKDVTEERRPEQATVTSETGYRHLVENSLGLVFTCTLEYVASPLLDEGQIPVWL